MSDAVGVSPSNSLITSAETLPAQLLQVLPSRASSLTGRRTWKGTPQTQGGGTLRCPALASEVQERIPKGKCVSQPDEEDLGQAEPSALAKAQRLVNTGMFGN
jgi:hypothetical protein